jgi:hypothetical protein
MQQNNNIESVQFGGLWKMLLGAVAALPRVYLLFDALDELAVEKYIFLQRLLELAQTESKSIKLLMTSRPLPYLQKLLTGPHEVSLRLSGYKVEQDLIRYTSHRMANHKDGMVSVLTTNIRR